MALWLLQQENLFCLLLQNPLDHDDGQRRLENEPSKDLKFYGHSYIYSLM